MDIINYLTLLQDLPNLSSVREYSVITLLTFAVGYLWRENNKKDIVIENKDKRIREVIENHIKDKDAHTDKIESVTRTAYEQVKDIINDLKGILEK